MVKSPSSFSFPSLLLLLLLSTSPPLFLLCSSSSSLPYLLLLLLLLLNIIWACRWGGGGVGGTVNYGELLVLYSAGSFHFPKHIIHRGRVYFSMCCRGEESSRRRKSAVYVSDKRIFIIIVK